MRRWIRRWSWPTGSSWTSRSSVSTAWPSPAQPPTSCSRPSPHPAARCPARVTGLACRSRTPTPLDSAERWPGVALRRGGRVVLEGRRGELGASAHRGSVTGSDRPCDSPRRRLACARPGPGRRVRARRPRPGRTPVADRRTGRPLTAVSCPIGVVGISRRCGYLSGGARQIAD